MRNPARKLLTRTKQELSSPVLEPQSKLPRKSVLRGPASCARNMGGCTKDCRRYKKDGMVKTDFHAAKKAGKKHNPVKQSFAQLSKKLDKLEKTLKKASISLRNVAGTIAILIANRKLGWVALGN
jgi:hypothetical protein